jgi:hypothetical protein
MAAWDRTGGEALCSPSRLHLHPTFLFVCLFAHLFLSFVSHRAHCTALPCAPPLPSQGSLTVFSSFFQDRQRALRGVADAVGTLNRTPARAEFLQVGCQWGTAQTNP